MNRADVAEMTVRKINPAVRVIDARNGKPRKTPANFGALKAAWQRRAAEMSGQRYEQVLKLIKAGNTIDEIAAELHVSRSGINNFICRHNLPSPISVYQKRRMDAQKGKK